MTVKNIILVIILCVTSSHTAFCQKTKPYKSTLPSNAFYESSNNNIESFHLKTSNEHTRQQKHPLEIWRNISPNNKEHLFAVLKNTIQSFLGESAPVEIDTEFTPLHSASFRQVGECIARKDKNPIAALEFCLPKFRIFNIFRVDMDFPNAAKWDEIQKYSNTWFNEIVDTDIPQIEKAWSVYKQFFTETQNCAFSLINCATKMSKVNEVLCNRTGYIWSIISPEKYPVSDECKIGSLMVQYHNGTLICQVQSIITENTSPMNLWNLSESAVVQIAKDHLISLYQKNKDAQNNLNRISKEEPDVEKILWIKDSVDQNGIVQYIPLNAYSIVFGYNGEWISPYLTDITIDASSGDILDSSSTSKERRKRFKQFCNNLKTDKALVFE